MSEYQDVYEQFWKELLENEDGTLDPDKVKRELSDFYTLALNAAAVYNEVTGGQISGAAHPASEVVDAFERHLERVCYSLMADYIEETLAKGLGPSDLLLQLRGDKKEYRSMINDTANSPG